MYSEYQFIEILTQPKVHQIANIQMSKTTYYEQNIRLQREKHYKYPNVQNTKIILQTK